jgi:uncharacterized protein YjbI with pentapeptide repeats
MATRVMKWQLLTGMGPYGIPEDLRKALGVPEGAPIGAHHVVGGDAGGIDPADGRLKLPQAQIVCGSCGVGFDVAEAEIGLHGWFDAGSSQLVTCPTCAATIRITGLYADPGDTGEAAGPWVVTTQQTTDPARHGVGWPAMVAAEVDVTTTVPEPPAAAAPPDEPLVELPRPPVSATPEVSGRSRRSRVPLILSAVAVVVLAAAGVAFWYLNRPCQDLVPLGDLAGCSFADRDLAGTDLSGADLSGADLAGADLTAALLFEAVLTDADLTGATLTDAEMGGVDATNAIFVDADLAGARLTDANLAAADLSGATLTRAPLNGADLTGAKLVGADLSQARMSRVDLTEADLSEATMTNVQFRNSTGDGANFTLAAMPDASLVDSSLVGADFDGADLSNTSLLRADFTSASLVGANLSGADLDGADFTDADLTAANLQDAMFTDVIGLGDAQLAQAFGVPEVELAAALVSRGIYLEPPSSYLVAAEAVRSGAPMAGAAPYVADEGFHPLLVLPETPLGSDPSLTDLPDWVLDGLLEGFPPAARFTQLVAIPETTDETVQTCRYTYDSGEEAAPITRVRESLVVRIYAAATGGLVAENAFVGSEPEACAAQYPASWAGTSLRGDAPDTEAAATWVASFVNMP